MRNGEENLPQKCPHISQKVSRAEESEMMKSEPVQLTRTTLISFCGPVHHRPLPPPLKHPSFTAQGWGQGSAAVPHLHKSWTPAHLGTKFTLDVCILESAAIHTIISSVQISNCIKSALSDESLFEEDTGRIMTHDIYMFFFYKQFACCYIHPVINWPAEDHSMCPWLCQFDFNEY